MRARLWAPSRRVLPFAEIAYSGRSAETDERGSALLLTGAGFGGSLGAMVFLQLGLALDIAATVKGGSLREVEFQGMTEAIDQGVTSGRFSIGLSWFSR